MPNPILDGGTGQTSVTKQRSDLIAKQIPPHQQILQNSHLSSSDLNKYTVSMHTASSKQNLLCAKLGPTNETKNSSTQNSVSQQHAYNLKQSTNLIINQ